MMTYPLTCSLNKEVFRDEDQLITAVDYKFEISAFWPLFFFVFLKKLPRQIAMKLFALSTIVMTALSVITEAAITR